MQRIIFFLIIALSLTISSLGVKSFAGGDDALHPRQEKWSFDGIFGVFDRQSARRGFQVYREVCASCHGLKLVAYRNLQELGYSSQDVKNIAAEYSVTDGPNDDGDMFERSARPSDRFVSPFPNEQAARAANGGAYPPDLSLIIKARPDGANYLHSLLTGYEDAPKGFQLSEGMSYNPYFPGKQIAMTAPLSDDLVEYSDGVSASVEQMSKDVVNFLQWAAEPEMEKRKKMGVRTMLFLIIMTVFFMIAKIRVWNDVK